jgi:hypothetical protein
MSHLGAFYVAEAIEIRLVLPLDRNAVGRKYVEEQHQLQLPMTNRQQHGPPKAQRISPHFLRST